MWVGQRLRRFEDGPLLTGNAGFVADLSRDCRFLRFVRSPIARGRIRGVDSPPDALVFTHEDLGDVGAIRPILHRPDYVPVEQPVLASEEVRFVGEPVAVVVGESQLEAEDVAERVMPDIEPLDPILDLDAALGADAPRVHALAPSNVVVEGRTETSGVDDAFSRATAVVEVEIRSGRESAAPIEPRGIVVRVDPGSDRLTIIASTQDPHVLRTILADLVRVPESSLRVIAPNLGGAFGQKQCLPPEYVVAVWLARKLGRSVAWLEDRVENLTASFHSRDQRYRVRGAFDADGRLLAIDGDLLCNVGAYSCYPVTAGVEPLMAMAELPGPYDFREYRVRSRGVTTNTCPMSPYRGVSRPVITLALERLMDTAGRSLGIDAVDMRRRNLIRSFPYTSVTGLTYDEGSYVECLEEAVRVLDLASLREEQRSAWGEGRYLGIGFSTFSERTGYGTPAFAARGMEVTPGYETVELTLDPSGMLEARIGASPHGQGLETTLAQVLADQLALRPEDVRVVHGDTDVCPYGWGTFASRSMVLSGGAATIAAATLREKVAGIGAHMLEVDADDVVLEEGHVRVRGADVSVPVREIARTAYHRSQFLPEGIEPGLSTRGIYDPEGTFSNACHVAVVEIDGATGAVSLVRYVVVEDAGTLINPTIVDGQIHGGVAQGIAGALYEELIYDELGNPLTASMMDYLLPTLTEIPSIEVFHLETPSAATLTGAKGLGEGGTIGAPAAVLNAISDALGPLGIEVNATPATPERLRALIRAKGSDDIST